MTTNTKDWELWGKLQANGLRAYSKAPEASCAVKGRADVQSWRKFLDLQPGMRVLDVGCGCIGTPAYLKEWKDISIYGIDPLCLPKAKWRGMIFEKALAECIPYCNSCFDVIMFSSSLDHVVDQSVALQEAKRCLRPNGAMLFWISTADEPLLPAEPVKELSWFGKRKSTVKQFIEQHHKPRWLRVNESMNVPEGAVDLFHFRRQTLDEYLTVFAGAGLIVERVDRNKHDAFIKATLASRLVKLETGMVGVK